MRATGTPFKLCRRAAIRALVAITGVVIAVLNGSGALAAQGDSVSESHATPGAKASSVDSNRHAELSTVQAPLKITNSRETKLFYRIGSVFDSFANEREQEQSIGLSLDGDLRMRLLPRLSLFARGSAQLASGYAQSRFGDQVPASGLSLQEVAMSVRVLNFDAAKLTMSAGALNQRELGADLLVSSQPFPGLRESLHIGSKAFAVRLWAQQTIPTSKTLSTRSIDAEVTPSFMTETVELSIQPSDSLKAKSFLTHFLFNNLPSAVAVDSIVYGNTTTETGPLTSQFKYRFEGLVAGGSVEAELVRSAALGLSGYLAQNAAAPEGYRNAQKVEGFLRIGLPGDIDLTPSAGTFFSESDVAPSFYNSSELGHNNRVGWLAAIETLFKKEQFKLRGEYVDADLINPSRDQSRQRFFMIRFETLYDLF